MYSKGRYEVDGYVYNKDEEPKIMVTGKWNTSMSYQPCDAEGEPLEGTELKEVSHYSLLFRLSLVGWVIDLVSVLRFSFPL